MWPGHEARGEPEQVTHVNNFTTDWPFTFSYVRVLEYDNLVNCSDTERFRVMVVHTKSKMIK